MSDPDASYYTLTRAAVTELEQANRTLASRVETLTAALLRIRDDGGIGAGALRSIAEQALDETGRAL